jgi:hypothetical protein
LYKRFHFISLVFIIFHFVFIFFVNLAYGANEGSECNASSASGTCYLTPSKVSFTVKGVWYCYGEPAAPTAVYANPAQGLGNDAVKRLPGNVLKQITESGCSTRIFNGKSAVDLSDGGASALSAGGAGQTQTFQWVVLQIEPQITMTASIQLNNTTKTMPVLYPTNTSSSSSVATGGTWCYTKGGDDFLVENGGQASVECSASNNERENKYKYNRLGTQNSANWTLSNGKAVKAWLTDSNNRLADGLTQPQVSSLQGLVGQPTDPFVDKYNADINPATSILVAFENPFTWYKCANKQKGTSSIDVSWFVTNALRVEFAGTNIINLLAPSSLDMYLEAPLRAGGAC